MSDTNDQLLLLGEIKGIVQGLQAGQQAHSEKLDAMDGRLRSVEQRAVVSGGVSGGVIAVGMALVTEGMKQFLGRGGSGS